MEEKEHPPSDDRQLDKPVEEKPQLFPDADKKILAVRAQKDKDQSEKNKDEIFIF